MGNSSSTLFTGPQSTIVSPPVPGSSGVYRNVNHASELVVTNDPAVKTLFDNWKSAVKRFGARDFLGVRINDGPYVFETYAQIDKRVTEIAAGLVKLGLQPGKDMLGIYAQNRPEWDITDLACVFQNIVSVPLYDTLGSDAVQFIVNQAEIPVVVCAASKTQLVLECAAKCPSLKTLVQMDDTAFTDEQKALAEKSGMRLMLFSEVAAEGRANPVDAQPGAPDSMTTICYTSGTTGDPKGAMLSHTNLIADATGGSTSGAPVHFTDTHISYLPLAHMMERMLHIAIIMNGARIGFFRGDILKLFDDILLLKPTIFVSVPRLYNRLYDKALASIAEAGGVKKALFDQAFAAKQEGLKSGHYTHSVWDKVVFAKLRARLGGNVRIMITGSAPIAGEVLEFLRVCFSCPVLEGYGQTETAACATMSHPGDTTMGHVGRPISCIEIKLADVPDMNYFATDTNPRGEICYRGPCVFSGYFKAPEKTAEAFDSDGWLHSGDIGMWLPNGSLKIIDRKKNIFKLSQGEYVAPEKIEGVYLRSPLVAQIFVYGHSLKSTLVAIVVPDFDVLKSWCKSQSIDADSREALVKNQQVVDGVQKSMADVAKQAGLKGFECVRAIRLIEREFTVEDDLLTPTFKLKRPAAQARYQHLIDDAYQGLD